MVSLVVRPMHRVVAPPVTTARVSGPSSQEEEPIVQEEADPLQVESSIVPKAPDQAPADPQAPRELGTLARGLMSYLEHEMVDMMLQGPLASLCQEEGVALCRRVTSSSSPKR